MALKDWSAKYSVNVPSMDRQHREMFEMIGELQDAVEESKEGGAAGAILEMLVACTLEHFADEEERMSQAGYEALDAHKAEHSRLAREMNDVTRHFGGGNTKFNTVVVDFLRECIRSHIMKSDMLYAEQMQTLTVESGGNLEAGFPLYEGTDCATLLSASPQS